MSYVVVIVNGQGETVGAYGVPDDEEAAGRVAAFLNGIFEKEEGEWAGLGFVASALPLRGSLEWMDYLD